jgi:serine/threonine protein kinase
MEKCESTLMHVVERGGLSSDERISVAFRDMLSGLAHLHSLRIVHRDVKPENLLIDRKFRLIIADFNFATRLSKVKSEHKVNSSN